MARYEVTPKETPSPGQSSTQMTELHLYQWDVDSKLTLAYISLYEVL